MLWYLRFLNCSQIICNKQYVVPNQSIFVLNNVAKQSVLVTIDLIFIDGCSWKSLIFYDHRRKNVMQVWNAMRVSEWWRDFHFRMMLKMSGTLKLSDGRKHERADVEELGVRELTSSVYVWNVLNTLERAHIHVLYRLHINEKKKSLFQGGSLMYYFTVIRTSRVSPVNSHACSIRLKLMTQMNSK